MRRSLSVIVLLVAAALLPAPAAALDATPSAPQALAASDGWEGVSVLLTWDPPADEGAAPIEQYWVERAQGGDYALVANLSTWQTYYRDGNVTAHTSYQYRVSAVNAFGQGETASVSWTTHDLPSAPQDLTAEGGADGIALAWQPPADPQGFTSYTLYRIVDGELWWHALLPSDQTSHLDATMEPGELRTYVIAAGNEYGPGALSNEATATRAAPDGTPSAPQDLNASDGWDGVSVFLSWAPPADEGDAPIEQYWVERAEGGDFALVANLSEWQTQYRDGNVSAHTSYQYRVSAVNAYGQGEPALVSWTTHDVASAPQDLTATGGPDGIALAWSPPLDPQGFTEYVVYRVVDGELSWLAGLDAAQEEYVDTEVAPNETRTYVVAAQNVYGPGNLSNEATATRASPPGAPQNLTAKPGLGKITLTWDAPASDGGAPLLTYNLWRGANEHDMMLIRSQGAGDRDYTDVGCANLVCYYRVSATNAVGEGARSEAVVGIV